MERFRAPNPNRRSARRRLLPGGSTRGRRNARNVRNIRNARETHNAGLGRQERSERPGAARRARPPEPRGGGADGRLRPGRADRRPLPRLRRARHRRHSKGDGDLEAAARRGEGPGRPPGSGDPHPVGRAERGGDPALRQVPDPVLRLEPGDLPGAPRPARRSGRAGPPRGGARPAQEVRGAGARHHPHHPPGRELHPQPREARPPLPVQGRGREEPRQRHHLHRRYRPAVREVQDRRLPGGLRQAQASDGGLQRFRPPGDPAQGADRLPPAAGALRLRLETGRGRHAGRGAGAPRRGRLQRGPERDAGPGPPGRQAAGLELDRLPRRAPRAAQKAGGGRGHPAALPAAHQGHGGDHPHPAHRHPPGPPHEGAPGERGGERPDPGAQHEAAAPHRQHRRDRRVRAAAQDPRPGGRARWRSTTSPSTPSPGP